MTVSGNAMAKAFAPVAGQLKTTEGAALNTAQALKFMKTAADLAEGSQTDLGTATASLSQVMQSFHLPLTDAAKASDLLFNVSRSLNVPIDQVYAFDV
jgi:TP901 family phage tail tape measure protein